MHACNGTIGVDKSTKARTIQLTGDFRMQVKEFLYEQGIAEYEDIKCHG